MTNGKCSWIPTSFSRNMGYANAAHHRRGASERKPDVLAASSACAKLGISKLRFAACRVPDMQDIHSARLFGNIIENAIRPEDDFA